MRKTKRKCGILGLLILAFLCFSPYWNVSYAEDVSEEELINEPDNLSQAEQPYSDNDDPKNSVSSQTIPVLDIEIEYEKNEILIDEIVNIYATVLPRDASEQSVSFSSNNSGIVSVNANGRVKGVSIGSASITVSAGNIIKRIDFTVRGAKTAAIKLNYDFIVLQPGESFNLTATVSPSNAPQKLVFLSLNKTIVEVSGNGTVKAHSIGNTSVTVSNGDSIVAVIVIVSSNSSTGNREWIKTVPSSEVPLNRILSDFELELISIIEQGNRQVIVSAMNLPVVTEEILKALYNTNAELLIEGNGYNLWIAGEDIRNFLNELDTLLLFNETKQGDIFLLNDGNKLPGRIALQLTGSSSQAKNIYLYNESKNKYEKLNAFQNESYILDEPGTYLLSDLESSNFSVPLRLIIFAGIAIGIAVVIYLVTNRRYLFW